MIVYLRRKEDKTCKGGLKKGIMSVGGEGRLRRILFQRGQQGEGVGGGKGGIKGLVGVWRGFRMRLNAEANKMEGWMGR